MRKRKERDLEPTIESLRKCPASEELVLEDSDAQTRIAATLALVETRSTWGDEMLRLKAISVMKLLNRKVSVQKFVQGNGKNSVSGHYPESDLPQYGHYQRMTESAGHPAHPRSKPCPFIS